MGYNLLMKLLILAGSLALGILSGCATKQATDPSPEAAAADDLIVADEDFIDFEADLMPPDSREIMRGAMSHRVIVERTTFAHATPSGTDPGLSGRTSILKRGDEVSIRDTEGSRVRSKLKSGRTGYVFIRDFEEIPDVDFDFVADFFDAQDSGEEMPLEFDEELPPLVEPDLPELEEY